MQYATIPGFFVQDDPLAVPTVVGALPPRFGLLDNDVNRWTSFTSHIDEMNANGSEAGEVYKVFFLGRHGQGYHNVAEAKYGTEAWDDFWSKLDGDGELIWGPDPLLTPLGEEQAAAARDLWKTELPFGIPLPGKSFSSPLKRALDTWKITFATNDTDTGSPVLPEPIRRATVLENCREEYGVHTCDRRSTLSSLQALYPPPTYTFEDGFPEADPLWLPDERESKQHITGRAGSVLDAAFRDPAVYISITAHGGFINGFLAAIGRPSYSLPTGGVIPVVVRATARN